jgi:hypothetical protein
MLQIALNKDKTDAAISKVSVSAQSQSLFVKGKVFGWLTEVAEELQTVRCLCDLLCGYMQS